MSDPSAARWRVDRKVRPALAQAGWADLPAVHQVLRFIMPDHRLTQRTEATGSTTALLIGVQFFELFGQLFRARCAKVGSRARCAKVGSRGPIGAEVRRLARRRTSRSQRTRTLRFQRTAQRTPAPAPVSTIAITVGLMPPDPTYQANRDP